MGAATGRPYGQDGGVVQLPLAIDRILAGQSPYGADYSDSILGAPGARLRLLGRATAATRSSTTTRTCRARTSLMMPFHLASRAAFGVFDPRAGHAARATGSRSLLGGAAAVAGATRWLAAAAVRR